MIYKGPFLWFCDFPSQLHCKDSTQKRRCTAADQGCHKVLLKNGAGWGAQLDYGGVSTDNSSSRRSDYPEPLCQAHLYNPSTKLLLSCCGSRAQAGPLVGSAITVIWMACSAAKQQSSPEVEPHRVILKWWFNTHWIQMKSLAECDNTPSIVPFSCWFQVWCREGWGDAICWNLFSERIVTEFTTCSVL